MCDTCDYANTVSRIEDLLDSSKLWSGQREFLESVAETIERMEHVTEKQRDAIEKIAERHGL